MRYNEKIKILKAAGPQLKELEEQRLALVRVKRKKLLFIMVSGVSIILCIVLWAIAMIGVTGIAASFIGLGLLAAAISYYMEEVQLTLQQKLQQGIGNIFVQHLYPGWEFKANHSLTHEEITSAGLHTDGYRLGNNLMRGKHGETNFAFCHFEEDIDNEENSRALFNGLLLIFDFHKSIKGKTLVFSDQAQKKMGSWLGKKIQEFGWGGLELVYLEDPIFEKEFVAYGSDQIEARYVLTPNMMTNLLKLRARFGENISFSFTKDKVAVAIKHISSSPFTNIDAPINPEAALWYFHQPIALATEVIDTLQLNTRIWAREQTPDQF